MAAVKYKEQCIACRKYFQNTELVRGKCLDCNSIRTVYSNMVQIPSNILHHLNLDEGSRIRFVKDEFGKIYIEKK